MRKPPGGAINWFQLKAMPVAELGTVAGGGPGVFDLAGSYVH